MVRLYSRATCAPCIALKRFLKAKNITYEELDLDEKPQLVEEMLKLSGYAIVPTVVIGNEVITGLDFARLNSLLSRDII